MYDTFLIYDLQMGKVMPSSVYWLIQRHGFGFPKPEILWHATCTIQMQIAFLNNKIKPYEYRDTDQ